MPDDTCTGVLVDFGNGCRYSLSCSTQREYFVKHPQIPPDVVKGENCQSHASELLGEYLKL